MMRAREAVAMMSLMTLASMAQAAPAAIAGQYQSPLGMLSFTTSQDRVTAVATDQGGPCSFKRGEVVFEGTLLEDNLTGTVRACRLGPGCQGDIEGPIMLLVTQGGHTLSGAAHLRTPGCQTPLHGDAIALRRISSSGPVRPSSAPPSDPSAIAKASSVAKGPSEVASNQPAGVSAVTQVVAAGPVVPPGSSARPRAELLAQRGARLMAQGSVDAARDQFLAAVEVDPSYSEGLVGVGVTHYLEKRYDDALTYYKRSLEADPGNRDAYYNTACVYALKGDEEQALRYLKIALLNGYIHLDTLARDPDLQALRAHPEFKRLQAGDL